MDDHTEHNEEPQGRQSFYFSSVSTADPAHRRIREKTDKVERLVTLTLQGIDKDLSDCNKTLKERVLPTLHKYNVHSDGIAANVQHVKEFFEDAANVNIVTGGPVEPRRATYSAATQEPIDGYNTSPIRDPRPKTPEAASTPKKRSVELTPVSSKRQHIERLIDQYDSPPWEEPPELECMREEELQQFTESRDSEGSRDPSNNSNSQEEGRRLTLEFGKAQKTEVVEQTEDSAEEPIPAPEEPISAEERLRRYEIEIGLDSDDEESPQLSNNQY